MASFRENLVTALEVMREALERKKKNRRHRPIWESRIAHQQNHTVEFRRSRLRDFSADLDELQRTQDRSLRAKITRGLTKSYADRRKSPDRLAEWLLYETELESRDLKDLLPKE